MSEPKRFKSISEFLKEKNRKAPSYSEDSDLQIKPDGDVKWTNQEIGMLIQILNRHTFPATRRKLYRLAEQLNISKK